LLALEFAAVPSVAAKALHALVIDDRRVVRRGWRNLEDVLVQHRLRDWGASGCAAVRRHRKPEFKVASVVSSDGSFDPGNAAGLVRDFRFLRAEPASSRESFAVAFVSTKSVVAFSKARCFRV